MSGGVDQLVVLAAERHDRHVGRCAREAGDTIAVQTCAVDQPPCGEPVPPDTQSQPCVVGELLHRRHFGPDTDRVAGSDDVARQRVCDGGVVDDASAGDVQRCDACRVGLESVQLARGDPSHLDPVVDAALLQRIQRPELLYPARDDDLSAPVDRQVPGPAPRRQLCTPPGDQSGLGRTGPVVQTGMHHAGVVPRLVLRRPCLLVEHHQVDSRHLAPDCIRSGQADDSGSHHDHVAVGRDRAHSAGSSW